MKAYLKRIPMYYYLGLLCLIIAVSATVFFVYNINYFQIDFGGHIASTAMFQKYGLHGWNPSWFQGLVNNLFYPPLEDILVSVIHFFSHTSNVVSFVIYVCFLIFGYWIGVYKLIRSNKHRATSALMFLGLTIFFFLNKSTNIVYFQGGSFFDQY